MIKVSTLLIYLLVGKLIIFMLQGFPFASIPLVGQLFKDGKFLYKLLSCDLCFGVWVYTVLSFWFGVNLFGEWFYIQIVSELISGAAISFFVHLVSIGWKDKFGQFVLE